ncbi:hypothetical protein EsH8_X_000378 [Colletotrichum jinshuiense]
MPQSTDLDGNKAEPPPAPKHTLTFQIIQNIDQPPEIPAIVYVLAFGVSEGTRRALLESATHMGPVLMPQIQNKEFYLTDLELEEEEWVGLLRKTRPSKMPRSMKDRFAKAEKECLETLEGIRMAIKQEREMYTELIAQMKRAGACKSKVKKCCGGPKHIC